jgi:hypothetical protein
MIKNEREYRITKGYLAGFGEGLIANDGREIPPNFDPGMKKLMHDAIASQIETFRHEIDHYEKLRDGHITGREITSLHELPIALIEARIAARLTQRQLICRCVCQVGVLDRTGVCRRWGCGCWVGAPGSVSALPV